MLFRRLNWSGPQPCAGSWTTACGPQRQALADACAPDAPAVRTPVSMTPAITALRYIPAVHHQVFSLLRAIAAVTTERELTDQADRRPLRSVCISARRRTHAWATRMRGYRRI